MLIDTDKIKENQSGDDDYYTRHRGERISTTVPTKRHTIRIPGRFFPHADFEDALWIKITPKQLSNVNTSGRAGTMFMKSVGTSFQFLAPLDLIEVHNHQWEAYDSFHSRLLEKIRAIHTGVDQFSQIGTQTWDEVKRLWNAGFTAGIMGRIEKAAINATNVTAPKAKIDTPLVYTNSARRTWDWQFTLCDVEPSTVLEAVQLLQSYAAPSSVDEIKIEFPYLFTLETIPEGVIKCQYAAITSVQPTFHGPYIEGKPLWCELNLSFMDMSPLYKQTLESGGIVNVVEDRAGEEKINLERFRKSERGEILE